MDTLRLDACQGDDSALPLLDKRDFQKFPNALAQSGWTKSSIASVFTGRDVLQHGVRFFSDKLSNDYVTLAETLKMSGYRTVGLTANPWISKKLGFGQGFDVYEQLPIVADEGVEVAIAEVKAHDGKQPLFLYLHLLDPHDPYDPPPPFVPQKTRLPNASEQTILEVEGALGKGKDVTRDLDDLRAFYLGEVRFVDQQLDRLLQQVEASGLYDDALIVFFSDHGDEFGEHGNTRHGNSLYQCLLSVPLRIKLPGGMSAKLSSETMIQHIDLMPTVLGLVNSPSLAASNGVDVCRASSQSLERRVALGYLETGKDAPKKWNGPWFRQYESAIGEGYKLHVRRADTFLPRGPLWGFFDLGSDPQEQKDLSSQGGVEMGYLWARMQAARAHSVVAPAGESQAVKDAFHTLPYMR